jgi:hypothetical protein
MSSFVIVLDEMDMACSMWEMRYVNILVGQPEGKVHLEDLGMDRIILKWV